MSPQRGVTVDEVRVFALALPRTTEGYVRSRLRLRIGRIVYAGCSADETRLGFAFPREERAGLVAGEPHKFLLPKPSDLQFNWVVARMSELDGTEMRELVLDAWRLVVPKRLAAQVGDDPLEQSATTR